MNENLLDDLSAEIQNTARRRSLIPVWIKIFIWIFMVIGVIAILGFILGISGFTFVVSLYGYETQRALSPLGAFLTFLFLYKGFVSYSLWFEKDWAITAGLVDAIIGIIICIMSMMGISLISVYRSPFTFRLEIIFLIPYLIKLTKLKGRWFELRRLY
jgi:hypothetical protein